MVDAKEGITPADELFARRLLKLIDEQQGNEGEAERLREHHRAENGTTRGGPPSVILVLNKSEGPGVADCMADAYNLQLGHPVLISTKTNQVHIRR